MKGEKPNGWYKGMPNKGKSHWGRVHLVEQKARTVWLKIRMEIKNGRK